MPSFENMTHLRILPRHILLAEDDDDDSMLFQEALGELQINTNLKRVKDGEELMQSLHNPNNILPDILFLDINMPRKNGFECLVEIKKNDRLKKLPVIIFSTSSGKDLVNKMYNAGASQYICKPNEFVQLKKIILKALIAERTPVYSQPPIEQFLLEFK